jgi:hypothetical protein
MPLATSTAWTTFGTVAIFVVVFGNNITFFLIEILE